MTNQYPICLAQDINLNLYTFNSTGGNSEYKRKKFTCDFEFNYKHLMMIDILTTLCFHNKFNADNMINNQFKQFIQTNNMNKIKTMKIDKPISIRFFDKGLKKLLPFLKKIRSKDFMKLIFELSDNYLKMKYPKIVLNNGVYEKEQHMVNSPLFTLNKCDNEYGGKMYKITFDTELGMLLMNNVMYANHSIVIENFYNMSGNAQLLYRYLILPYWKFTKKNINPNDIKERLNLKSTGYELLKRIIPRLLDELINNNLITEYKFLPDSCTFNYINLPLKEQKYLYFKNEI